MDEDWPAMASNRKHRESVINNLKDLFGNVLHIEIIRSVATECQYNVQRSSNILLEMTNNVAEAPKKKQPKKKTPQTTPTKPRLQPSPSVTNIKSKKTQELERVIRNIRSGYKVLVILRGLPGSGKSRLAVTISDATVGPGHHQIHVLSTDDFFMQQGGYYFDPQRLQEAHEWNHRRAFGVMSRGLSPVIIDNTNTQMWEMKPYAMMATDYGYMVEILEPDTFWCFNDKELAKRNIHGVPRLKIKDMLDRYDKNITPQKLLSAYNLQYKFQKPPQYRLIPPITQNGYTNFTLPPPDGVAKSKSTSALDSDEANLMDFTDNISETNFDSRDSVTSVKNPVDEILMCSEENSANILQPEPPPKTGLFPDVENAWGVDTKALQSWDIVTPISCDVDDPFSVSANQSDDPKPVMVDGWSYTEESDLTDCRLRLLAARGRDINLGSPVRSFQIPKKAIRDQSCDTEDLEIDEKSEETAIRDLMDLFPRVPRSSLQDLFNRCHKNFTWTVDLLLEDNHLDVDIDDKEEIKETPIVIQDSEDEEVMVEENPSNIPKATPKPNKQTTNDSIELKKWLEDRIEINKEHYSDHVLKVKQTKFGGYSQDPQPSTSATIDSDSDTESDISSDDPKSMIQLNLGDVFVEQLETMFGGDDGAFPKGFQPVVQMPLSLARQIYSFYVESVCQQMEAQNHILDRLVKEDEEFARKLQLQDFQQQEGQQLEGRQQQPQDVPNFSEIMDEQVALSLHKKEVDEWKNMTADNLAARLTKQKLFNTFPNIDKESLVEIWHAYDYDYNKTVSDLIASVGAENVNGSGEAVREPPLSTATLDEMKEAETNYHMEEPEGTQPATFYREQANKHLQRRADLYEKAKSYYQRGMHEVAMFYSELAKKETNAYDRANHIAAAAFIDEHSKRLQKFDTLDLHYFYVKEAIPNLDIFIDRNINLLKGGTKRGTDLYVITGRGKNSEGGRCKIKPAVIARLKKRKIGFVQMNPGLLKIRVLQDSLITSDLP